ncbi:MAG: DUF393 domain-containing protein [Tabrizicola sp.]|nr:DUF393 domain-containing protein [Tabrizicola sp.]
MSRFDDLIVFDAQCIFCSAFARLVHRQDRKGRFRFVTAQSATGQALYRAHGLDPAAMETNIVIVDGTAHVKMQAFAAAMRALGGLWPVMAFPALLPRVLGDWIYDRIARNRYVLGRKSCPVPPAELKARLIE